MHVVLATVGTDGDVFPYIGLGSKLLDRGHRVSIAAPETYRDHISSRGLEFHSLVTIEDVNRMLSHPDLWHPLRSGPMMARWGGAMIPQQYEVLSNLVRIQNAVLVANPGVLAARLVQEKLNCQLVTLLLQPGLIPSNVAPPEMAGGLTMPTWLPNSLRSMYWRAVDIAGYVLVAPYLNRFRSHLGMPPIRRVFQWWLSPDLVVGLFPASYAAPQADWPPQLRLAGFGRYDGTENKLPEDVLDFCTCGPPPIVFTLGTGMTHATKCFQSAVIACERIGVRGLLLTKYPKLVPRDLPHSIHSCRFASFRKLLPHCAAIVHHGGVGTTAAALDAGCPQLILPMAWDQPDNACRVTKLGVGSALGPRQRCPGSLARALSYLITPEIRDRCQSVASRMQGLDGLEVAADFVEQIRS
jgi:rhamnosyltransferase subunit B